MLNIGIIGAGLISNSHAKAIINTEDANLISVSDINENTAKKFAKKYNCRFYTNSEKMLENEKLDFVIICLPTFLHAEYVTLCAKYRVNVLCEKPIEMSVGSTKKILQAVKEFNIIFMTAQVVRFWTGYAEIKEMIDSGEVGDIYMAFASRCSTFQSWGNTWLMDPDQGGGAIQDMHVHDIDYLRYIIGPVDDVYCHASKDFTGCWNHVMSSLSFENGSKAVAEAAFTMQDGYPFSMLLKIAGTKATIDFYFKAGNTIDERNNIDTQIKIYRKNKEPKIYQPALYDGYTKQLKYFIQCLKAGKQPEVVPHSENLEVMEIIQAIKKSADNKKIVYVKREG